MNTLIEQERKLIDLLTRSVHRTFADARAAGVPADVFDDVEAIAQHYRPSKSMTGSSARSTTPPASPSGEA